VCLRYKNRETCQIHHIAIIYSQKTYINGTSIKAEIVGK
jgi:hypothetical protein